MKICEICEVEQARYNKSACRKCLEKIEMIIKENPRKISAQELLNSIK